jgi:uncharacterized protein
MKIAIVGSGISGLYAAHYLSKQHEITIYEANPYPGGHTDTHNIFLADRNYAVDTGFIVFNEHNYPYFCAFLRDLGVASQPSDMSFSVTDATTGLEYNATTLDKLFCQRRNLFRPRFYRMILDIIRFYREAPTLLDNANDDLTLGDYLQQQHYSQTFIDDHILPMACALWSGPPTVVQQFPARYLVAFMSNHEMLKTKDRTLWRTVCGGSSTYIKAFTQQFKGEFRLNCPVQAIRRDNSGITVTTADNKEQYDCIILACHSDQALALLQDATDSENNILGCTTYRCQLDAQAS